jgi:hypothetical protein
VLKNHPDYFSSLPEDVKDKLLSYLLRTKVKIYKKEKKRRKGCGRKKEKKGQKGKEEK